MRSSFGLLFVALLFGCPRGSPPHPRVGDAHSAGDALTVCPAGATVQGADVSSYQDTIDWVNVAADAGLTFAIAKATEGLTVQDSEFAANWSGMKANGIVRGAYHFFHPGDDGAAQADAFLAQVGSFEPGDLPPFLDWEVIDSSTAAHSIEAAQNFINEIQAKTGLTTVIYTYPDFWENTLGSPTQFAGYPVWWANYVACPDLPSTWSAWQFWQYSSTATVPGMNCPGACDVDEFNGSAEDLHAFALAAQANCGGASATCGSDAGCCYGLTCEQGTCQAPDCTAIWGACTEASECCSGMTCLTWTPSGATAGTYCCDGVGAACGDSRDCCGGSLCSSTGTCLCVPADTYCQNDADCCAGLVCESASSNCKAAPATSSSTSTSAASSATSGSSGSRGSTGTVGASTSSATATAGASGTSTGGSTGAANASTAASGTSGSSGTESAGTLGATSSTGGNELGGSSSSPDAGSGAKVSSRGCSSSAGDVGLWSVLASAALGLARRRHAS